MGIWQKVKKGVIPLVVVALGVGVFAVLKATKPVAPLKEIVERSWPVAIQKVDFQSIRPQLKTYGEIRAGREAELRPQVMGTVISVHPDLGDGSSVRAGEVLVRIDDFDYVATLEERRADLAEAQAKLNELEQVLVGEEKLLPGDKKQVGISLREVERQRKLLKRSAVSRKSLDDAQATLNDRQQAVLVREQSIARTKTQIIQAQASQKKAETAMKKAMRDVEETELKAPFDGFLTETDVTEGKQVSTSDRLGRLISLDRLEASFYLSEAQYAHLTRTAALNGKSITVTVARGETSNAHQAVINRMDARVDPATGGRTVFATLSGLKLETGLRPGLFVEVDVPDVTYEKVVSVPAAAVHDAEFVYVVKDGRLTKRPIKIAAKDGTNLLISDGLEKGENICVTRFAEMGQGIKVAVK